NADTIASQVACALSEFYDVTLTFCFEKPGVLSDADDDSSVIPHITKEKFQQLVADGVISGGMLPKLENAYDAINKGVARVMITRADNLDGSNGTLISE
ncbi:MAG: acetylglutamate kinase, partial [Bacteroidaceae bacterium]|nr:acetylglutamate kinase [Bacteroidaceae bacterium]